MASLPDSTGRAYEAALPHCLAQRKADRHRRSTKVWRAFPRDHGKYRAVSDPRDGQMPAIMSLEEPRPRGTVLGEGVDGLRVHEVEHFFRCKACNGWIDARDLMDRGSRRSVAASRAGRDAVESQNPLGPANAW